MTRLVRQPFLYLLLSMLIFMAFLAGCGGDDEETPVPQPATIALATPDAVAEGATQPAAQSGGTLVRFVTATPSLTPSITPTFDFLIDDYSGIWAFELAINVSDGKPISEIEQWSYSAQVALVVDEYGLISVQPVPSEDAAAQPALNEVVLFPTHYSPACTIEVVAADPSTNVNPYAPFRFMMAGQVRDDPDNNIFFDLTLIPINAGIAESYDIDCVFEESPRNETFQYIWPVLQQGGQLSFSLPIQGGRFAPESRFEIDVALVTGGQLTGNVQGNVSLFRQQ